MRFPGAMLTASLLCCGLGTMLAAQAAPAKTATTDAPVVHEAGSPPFHRVLPKGPLPKTLNPEQFSDPRIRAVYAMAAQIRGVLYQQPCYCGCDKEVGHTSLLDCYVGNHASICETCLMEGMFAYQQTKAGKTPGQIRAAIMRGEWKTVNLNSLITARTY